MLQNYSKDKQEHLLSTAKDQCFASGLVFDGKNLSRQTLGPIDGARMELAVDLCVLLLSQESMESIAAHKLA